MDRAEEVAVVLRCPVCQAAMRARGRGFVCTGRNRHRFPGQGGYVTFAKPDPGKYQRQRAQRYAAIQAFGYQTRHFGGQETVYRTVSSLVAECLASAPATERPVIVDCGCGVGRVAADCAVLAGGGFVIAIDASRDMLDMASRIVLGRGSVAVPSAEFPPDKQYRPEHHGLGKLRIPGRGATNVILGRADRAGHGWGPPRTRAGQGEDWPNRGDYNSAGGGRVPSRQCHRRNQPAERRTPRRHPAQRRKGWNQGIECCPSTGCATGLEARTRIA